ncbi:LCP family protein, partial [Campylobacter jejuni]
MSILRDLYVDIPGHGKGKINSALAKGGYELTVDTVEELLDIEVNHLVEIDFQGFRGVTEALGGVSVCNPTA